MPSRLHRTPLVPQVIGRKLSNFRILERIGEGGMGVFYRAEDERLQRTVAAVTHPNIAAVQKIEASPERLAGWPLLRHFGGRAARAAEVGLHVDVPCRSVSDAGATPAASTSRLLDQLPIV